MSDKEDKKATLQVEVEVELMEEARKFSAWFNSPTDKITRASHSDSRIVNDLLLEHVGEVGSQEWNEKNAHRFV